MGPVFERLGPRMGVAVAGVDLSVPTDDATVAALRGALLEGQVLCVRGQALSPAAYRSAIARFGDIQPQLRVAARHPEVEDIVILSSEDRDALGDGKRLVVGAHWHTDDSFMARPCSLTALYGVRVPPSGGDTQFVDMYAAYDALDAADKARLGGLRAVHRYDSSRKGTRVARLSESEAAAVPEVDHPLVRTHPETGRKALYLNPNRMERVVGMDRAESDALLDRLVAHAIRPEFQHRHVWRIGDVLMWDNRCTMHKANADYPEGSRREMHRLIVAGDVPV